MKIVYQGPFIDGETIQLPRGRYIVALPGEPIEVEDTLGSALLQQGNNWKAVKPEPSKKSALPEEPSTLEDE